MSMDRHAQIEYVLDHYQNPRNRGEMPDASAQLQGGHEGCSDIVTMYIKVDGDRLENESAEFYSLGVDHLHTISAEHNRGVVDLIENLMDVFPPADPREADDELTKIAVVGRPNVGKSSLVNRLLGFERVVANPTPGTTRDSIDTLFMCNKKPYLLIDTAGIRRKGKTKLVAEKLSVVMARKHLEEADIALLIIDAAEGVTALDANIAGYAHESGRSVIIVVNKWDLVSKKKEDENARRATTRHRGGVTYRRGSMMGRLSARAGSGNGHKPADRQMYEQELRHELKFLDYAPVVFVSAKAGKNVDKIFELVTQVAVERRKRIPTAAMNRFVQSIDFDRASVPFSRRVKILYMTQAGASPPTFVLFTDRAVKLHFSYERFLENQIRRSFGFAGTPIRIKTRARS